MVLNERTKMAHAKIANSYYILNWLYMICLYSSY